MSNISKAVNSLTNKAHKLSKNFHELLNKSTVLLADSQNVDQMIIDSCGVQDDQLLKNLVKYCNDDERIHQLLENAELKQTLEEYKAGIEHIMQKYKYHCQGNILNERYNLRAKYVAGLQAIANSLDRRIEEMTLIMMFTVGLEEHSSSENQRIIQQLKKENEMMRRQLQISNNFTGKNSFQQNQPIQIDASTQLDQDNELTKDSGSASASASIFKSDSDSDSGSESFHSFVTCFSYSCESQSNVSEIEQSKFKKQQ
ncbi:FGFR1 oncogene partner 2 homolog [Drosophila innubila]|uniref:FGFR1 oncogene partner 2 homolog n=1 Tax=Drosophila innubila TaxID=198719 RepID=UPI00148E61FE|nr:FGFR1 oncogene partner 2 homolog [Drosophila innubila]